jgi:hypothetical protein
METEKKLQAKKRWEQPQLLVLVRSEPEEAVLAACKSGYFTGPPTVVGCAPGKPPVPCSGTVGS